MSILMRENYFNKCPPLYVLITFWFVYLQRTGPKMLDHEGKSLPGNRGYK